MFEDDLPRGRLLSRRQALTLFGAGGALLLLRPPAGDSPSAHGRTGTRSGSARCVARPELTEGPYYVDEQLNRSDIRSDPFDGSVREGTLLALTFNLSRLASNGCSPLPGAVVDLWHCDALGHYSDVSNPNFDTKGRKYLRGYQVTDAGGIARFTTIFPGWYQGRAVHIHFKVRSPTGRSPASADSAYEFTSQLFFDEALIDQVHAREPYAAQGQRARRNAQDRIYRQGGSQLLLAATRTGGGYAATFDLALQAV